LYICARFGNVQIVKSLYKEDFKNIRQCQKERFNRQKEKEETNTVLEKEWLLQMEEKYLHVEELKEERNCLYQLKQDIKNND
jgi:hypothetical protein